jgi:SAM-dependent methyltransferase
MTVLDKLRKVRQRLRDRGVWQTARWALASTFYYPITRWIDHRFDRKYHTETTAALAPARFAVAEELRRHAVEYVASPAGSFVRFLREQELDFTNYTFVDLGCGKGRTLLLAALRFPFQRVVGVEFEPRIYEICKQNIDIFLRSAKVHCVPEVVCMSAGAFAFPPGDLLLYLFNPFDEHVMSEVAANLRAALASGQRHVRVVYSHPNADGPLLQLAGARLLRSDRFRDRSSLHGVGRLNVYDITSPPRT